MPCRPRRRPRARREEGREVSDQRLRLHSHRVRAAYRSRLRKKHASLRAALRAKEEECERLKRDIDTSVYEIVQNTDSIALNEANARADTAEERERAEYERGQKFREQRDEATALLKRWWGEGASLGASHPHFAAYHSHPEDLWTATKAALARETKP